MVIGWFLNNAKIWTINAMVLDCLYHCHINWNTFYNKTLVCTGDLINPLLIGFFGKDLTKSDHFMR